MPLTRMKSYRPKAQAPRFGQPARWRGRAMQQSREHFFIGNQWVAPSSGRRFTLTNASTEEAIGTVPEAIEADVDAAVAAARKAFDGGDWSDLEIGRAPCRARVCTYVSISVVAVPFKKKKN